VTAAALAVALAACGGLEPPPAAPPDPKPSPSARARFVPGEAIVKLRAAGETKAAPETDAKAHFQDVAAKVARETGWPVEVRRSLSGGELLLGLRLDAMTKSLLEEARRDPRLTGLEVEDAPTRGSTATPAGVRGRAAGSGIDAVALARDLSARAGFEVAAKVAPAGEVHLSVDAEAATLRLVEALKKRSDVEYAQPNYRLTKIRR
jgi:hypothetical protein